MYFYDPVSCDKIDINYVDKKVYLTGMIDSIRRRSDIIIMNIRDRSGTIQAVINPKFINSKLYKNASSLEEKNFITICGIIEYRDLNKISPNMKTGRLELIADDFFLTNPEDNLQIDLVKNDVIFTEDNGNNLMMSKFL